MDNSNQILILRDNAKADLMQIKTVEAGLEYASKLKAIEAWGKAKKLDSELMVIIHEQTLRTERALGKLIKEGQAAGEIASQESGFNQYGHTEQGHPKTLDEIGLTRKQSANFKKLDAISDEDFEEVISEKKSNIHESLKGLSTTGIIKAVEEKKKSKTEINENKAEYDLEVKELLSRINALPVLYRLKIKQGIRRGK